MASHNDDRNMNVGLGQLPLEIKATSAGQPNVKNEASWHE